MKTILDKIFDAKRIRVEKAKRSTDLVRLSETAREIRARSIPGSFRAALQNRESVNIIAEFKKASPSKGVISNLVRPDMTARQYEDGGACAISVLTEEDFFQGSLDDLRVVREAASLPILRKDFIFDEFQVFEAAAAGADAILLIVAATNADSLRNLHHLAEDELGMDVLVEVHTREEMEVAKDVGAFLIGVNNRDLHTFEVSLDVSRELVGRAPPGGVLVSESGLQTHEALIELKNLGYAGFLIGETLMRSGNPESELRDLIRQSTAATSL